MLAFSTVWKWLERPLVLGPIAAAVGAGAAICVLGIPPLWSQEAAGWASAFGSFAAAVAAVGVAFVPRYFDSKRDRFAAGLAAEKLIPELKDLWERIRFANHHRYMVLEEQGGDLLMPKGFGRGQQLGVVIPSIPVAPEFGRLHRAIAALTEAVGSWNRLATLLPNQGGYELLQDARAVSDVMKEQSAVIEAAIKDCFAAMAELFTDLDNDDCRLPAEN